MSCEEHGKEFKEGCSGGTHVCSCLRVTAISKRLLLCVRWLACVF